MRLDIRNDEKKWTLRKFTTTESTCDVWLVRWVLVWPLLECNLILVLSLLSSHLISYTSFVNCQNAQTVIQLPNALRTSFATFALHKKWFAKMRFMSRHAHNWNAYYVRLLFHTNLDFYMLHSNHFSSLNTFAFTFHYLSIIIMNTKTYSFPFDITFSLIYANALLFISVILIDVNVMNKSIIAIHVNVNIHFWVKRTKYF